jgi:uncharacterized membrane protein
MTRNLSPATQRRVNDIVGLQRLPWVDVFRGLLIAHMALDHASLFFNSRRAAEELAATGAPVFDNVFQFLTRFLGVPVAPGFCFMAGFMVALTSGTRAQRGVSHVEVTRRLIIRGLVLIAVDALIMGLPRALMGFYSFMVLTTVGVAIVGIALLRDVPTRVLLPVALGILVLHPLIDVSGLPVWLQAIVYEPVRTGAFRSMYPVLPWFGIVLLGFVIGRDAQTRERPVALWAGLSIGCVMLFFAIRLSGGYGNAYPYTSVASLDFWMFSKYPPDLPFLAWSFAVIFLTMALLAGSARLLSILRPLQVFGRVPFFFYVVHFYVLGILQAVLRTKVGLPTVYCIWVALLFAMAWPCAWYFEKRRDRPSFITRYF